MSNVTINITVPTGYISLKEYAVITGIPFDTCRGMVRDGRIIIRPKVKAGDKVEVNLVAMLKDAIANS
ncbi:DNA-binding protein [Yersinia ruckeri]|uniref:DNA-binding protein n=1 Tax=Yersinia ruckeri TaxID=29486 RepID=UPI0020C0FD51|nr:DNA-binding protein [Yersinia ruckeri]ELM3740600.1 DNA-binding protein [Yersinia ruckeri]MCK8542052.1 DNA-binding protein [Yersinia ruckeri]MCK8553124.1 DNA-binding protein [Yersinia ruckeri]MCW6519248.1 DNA-binding protein [Yersinia ruckeri]MCW6553502.1 DNA-binding protein [Yersinia ruckeri]